MISERHRLPAPGTPEFDTAYEVISERIRDYTEVLEELSLFLRNATSFEVLKQLMTNEIDRINGRLAVLKTDLALLKAQLIKPKREKKAKAKGKR